MKFFFLLLLLAGMLWGGSASDKQKLLDSVDLSKFHKFDVSPDYYNGVLWRWYTDVKVTPDDLSKKIQYSSVYIFYTSKIKSKKDVLKAGLVTAYFPGEGAEECAIGIGGMLAEDHKFMWPILTGYNELDVRKYPVEEANIKGFFLVYAPKYKTGFIERGICLPTDMVKDLIINSSKFHGDTLDQKRFFERFGQYGLKPEITFEEIEKNIKNFHIFPIEKFPIDEN